MFFNFLFGFLLLSQSAFSQEDFRKNAPQPDPAPKITLGKSEQFTLNNGLKVIVVENHKLPRVSFQIFVDVPPFLEGDYAGSASLAGQMLGRGTKTRSKAQIDEAVDFIGASLNTSANGVSGSSLTRHKDKLLDIMADALFNPVFPEEEFEKLKKQTLSGLQASKDDPNAIASNVASVLRNGKNHPYGEIETESTISDSDLERCKAYYNTYFKPNISYFIVTGDITAKDVRSLAVKYFGDWKKGEVARDVFPVPQRPETTQLDFVDKAGAVQSVINITYPIDLKPGHDDAIKASVMNTLLGAYFGSRLMSNLREDKGYTYGARSSLSADPVIGNFTAYASVRNEVTDSSIVQFLVELNRLRKEAPPQKELDMVKNVMTGSFARSLESPATVARFALSTARYKLPEDYYSTYLEKISKVTQENILEMAMKYLAPDQAYILVVGNKDEVADKLGVFSADNTVNYYDVYGNKIEDAGLSVPEGVTAETVLADYLAAIGDPANLKGLKDIKIVMSTEIQGMTLETTLYHKTPNRLRMDNSMMGTIAQQSIFDGTKGVNVQMGQKIPMEPDQLEDMQIDSRLFPERYFAELGVKTELKGVEMVEGKKAYKVAIEYPSGTKKTDYFDVETSLKIREIEQNEGMTTTNDYSDYKVVDGIKIYHKVTIAGGFPVPLMMETKSIEVNSGIGDEVFKVE